MNKNVKNLLLLINIVMLLLAIKWYFEKKETEPLIVILGQFSALVVLLLENKISSSVNAKKNKKTHVEVNASKGDKVDVNENEDSSIRIKTRN